MIAFASQQGKAIHASLAMQHNAFPPFLAPKNTTARYSWIDQDIPVYMAYLMSHNSRTV